MVIVIRRDRRRSLVADVQGECAGLGDGDRGGRGGGGGGGRNAGRSSGRRRGRRTGVVVVLGSATVDTARSSSTVSRAIAPLGTGRRGRPGVPASCSVRRAPRRSVPNVLRSVGSWVVGRSIGFGSSSGLGGSVAAFAFRFVAVVGPAEEFGRSSWEVSPPWPCGWMRRCRSSWRFVATGGVGSADRGLRSPRRAPVNRRLRDTAMTRSGPSKTTRLSSASASRGTIRPGAMTVPLASWQTCRAIPRRPAPSSSGRGRARRSGRCGSGGPSRRGRRGGVARWCGCCRWLAASCSACCRRFEPVKTQQRRRVEEGAQLDDPSIVAAATRCAPVETLGFVVDRFGVGPLPPVATIRSRQRPQLPALVDEGLLVVGEQVVRDPTWRGRAVRLVGEGHRSPARRRSRHAAEGLP